MEQGPWLYLADSQATTPIEGRRIRSPLSIDFLGEAEWVQIKRDLQDFETEDQKKIPIEDRISTSAEKIPQLVIGTLNIINFILDRKESDPIRRVVFLDKAARPAAHFFRVLWDELQKIGTISQSFLRPEFRFINVGRMEAAKAFAPRASLMASQIFKANDFLDGTTLVIDEYSRSGSSLKRGMKELNSEYSAKVEGMVLMSVQPAWYRLDDQKGVEDPALPANIYQYTETFSDETFEYLFRLIKSGMNRAEILELLAAPLALRLQEFQAKYSKDARFPIAPLQAIHQDLNFMPDPIIPENIYTYFKTNGGYLALQPTPKIAEKSYRFRKYLAKLAELVADKVQLSN